MAAQDNKPTLHHLNDSQSQRILWLLEELDIPYNLVLYERNPASDPVAPYQAPAALKATGPYGRSPLLVAGAQDGHRYIPESHAIVTYLLRTFDSDGKKLGHADWIRDEILCSLIATSLSRANYCVLMLDFGIIKNGTKDIMDIPGLHATLTHFERELKEGGGKWFMGDRPGRPDFLAEFALTTAKARKWVDYEKDFPALNAWLTMVYERPAWKRAMEKGNGYDMGVFPRFPRE
ncbi:hypothetical protein BP6252_09478 [Coleophoma cylindrospora]|uniref:Glutathione S-transferase n=1 Tax=Coleophoma cylindrospora TaxID=1849047 RepID=A0A3D8R208_9HELO|nr:hypothetical protein BP6252_09478 [Coleophoma cylindrospora]